VRRRQVAYVHQRGVSLRRACALLSVARSTLRYESRLAKRDAPAVAVMHELAAQYPRYGYRRNGRKSSLGVRLRVRRLRERSAVEVPDSDR